MAWTASNLSGQGVLTIMNGMAATSGGNGPFYTASGTQSFHGDTVNAALYNNSVTTSTARDDTLAHNAYLAALGQWVTANEITGTGYTAGGVAITPKAETYGTGVATFTSSGSPSWTTATITAYGVLVYDATITAKYAYCWNYFGGVQTVTAGTFSVAWNASGIFTITVT